MSPNEGCIITILVQENIYRVNGTCNSSFIFARVDIPQVRDRGEAVPYRHGFQAVYEDGHQLQNWHSGSRSGSFLH